MKKVCDQCTGCSCCKHLCQVNAITMITDELGSNRAMIDETKCVNCGLCKNSCPQLNTIALHEPKSCYAAWTKNNKDYLTTSSGGIATVLSKFIISRKGVVYGAAFSKQNIVAHMRVSTIADLEKLKGSKYVQSQMEECYKLVKEDLNKKIDVLFIGCPCEVAGLYAFLSKEYSNLYTVDLICHGVPPTRYLEEYINTYLKIDINEIDSVSFRQKKWKLSLIKDDSILYEKYVNYDRYFEAFQEGLIFRNNCYSCRYAKKSRIGDITIGDFWGLKQGVIDNAPKFISCVLINNDKGKVLFDEVNDSLCFYQRSIDEAVLGNANLQHPSHHHKDEYIFRKEYINNGFVAALDKTSITKTIRKYKVRNIILAPYHFLRHCSSFFTGGGYRIIVYNRN